MDQHSLSEKLFLYQVELIDRLDREHKATMKRMKMDLSIQYKNMTPADQLRHKELKEAAESLIKP